MRLNEDLRLYLKNSIPDEIFTEEKFQEIAKPAVDYIASHISLEIAKGIEGAKEFPEFIQSDVNHVLFEVKSPSFFGVPVWTERVTLPFSYALINGKVIQYILHAERTENGFQKSYDETGGVVFDEEGLKLRNAVLDFMLDKLEYTRKLGRLLYDFSTTEEVVAAIPEAERSMKKREEAKANNGHL